MSLRNKISTTYTAPVRREIPILKLRGFARPAPPMVKLGSFWRWLRFATLRILAKKRILKFAVALIFERVSVALVP